MSQLEFKVDKTQSKRWPFALYARGPNRDWVAIAYYKTDTEAAQGARDGFKNMVVLNTREEVITRLRAFPKRYEGLIREFLDQFSPNSGVDSKDDE